MSVRGPNRNPEIYLDESKHHDRAVAISAYRQGCRCDACRRHVSEYQAQWESADRVKRSRQKATPCEMSGCTRQARKRAPRGICNEHYYERLGWPKCAEPGCARHSSSKSGTWCPSHIAERPCESCGRTVRMSAKAKWCSSSCGRGFAKIRNAVAESNFPAIKSEIENLFGEDGDFCWHYTNISSRGYGAMLMSGQHLLMHRVSKSADVGRWLLPHEVVHHKCANKSCINPSHLQVVEQAHNAAEMMNRRYYEQRIAALEAEVERLRNG